MALSNITKEPRREITEQLVGTIALMALLIPDYWLASWVQAQDTHTGKPPLFLYMVILWFVLGFAALLLWVALVLIHALGEYLCDSLAKRGIEIRPKERY